MFSPGRMLQAGDFNNRRLFTYNPRRFFPAGQCH